jgi:hypothetical protein
MNIFEPTGPTAARLSGRKQQLLTRLRVPSDAFPGSLALTHRRCGKPSCHCADSEGHPLWSLTFMAGGKKRVEHIPADWVEAVRPRVEAGRGFKQAIADLFVTNVELLVQSRKQRRRPAARGRKGKRS